MLAGLARAQHGVVGRRQLLAAGIHPSDIARRVRTARLHVIHRGVYAVAHRVLGPRGWWMAAVLSCGPRSLLSHRSAAALLGLVDGVPTVVDVATTTSGTSPRGVRRHRVRDVPMVERSRVEGIPCTSPSRTLVDLASVLGERPLDRALRRAVDLRVFDRHALDGALRRGRPGSAALRRALGAMTGAGAPDPRTKSELERRFLELIEPLGVEPPSSNVVVGTPWAAYEVDVLWPRARVVVELDGWTTHRDREAFRRDHARDADLIASGYVVLRLTWDQVVDHPRDTALRVARLLRDRADGRSPLVDPVDR